MSKTFCQRLIDSCTEHAPRTAMRVVGDESEVYTYEEMLARIRNVAWRLRENDVRVGDRVAVIGENHPCWAIAYLATLYAGAVCVPLDPHGEIETLTNFLEDSEAKIAFLSPHVTEKFEQISEKLGRRIPAVVWRNGGSVNGFQKFEDWTTAGFPEAFAAEPPPAGHEDNALLIYTSGTTGKPKGVLLSHRNITAELDAIDHVLEFSHEESVLSLLPLFHVYLQIVNLWLAATKGAEVFYLKELTPDELSRAMLECRMTAFTSVPRLWYLFHKKIFDEVAKQPRPVRLLFRFLHRLNGLSRDHLNLNLGRLFFRKVHDSFGGRLDLAVSGGSRFDADVAIDFYRLGFNILQGYGLSETSGAATATYPDDNRVGSVGKPMLGAEIRIADPNGEGVGEVQIRGPIVFDGYYRNPEATREAFTEDGWFRSGDLGRFDEDGHLYIVGRAKDVIVLPSGKNVHPEDLEVHYLKSPLVEELCVLGVEDREANRRGAEKLVAVVVPDFEYLRQSNIANSRELIRFELDNLGRELPEYQRVRDYIIRSEAIPRTATRKIKRFELQKEIESGALAEAGPPAAKAPELSREDEELLASRAGRALVAAVNRQKQEPVELHPEMNLEIDLRLDSLARAEILASLEQTFGFEFDPEEATQAFKVGELIRLTRRTAGSNEAAGSLSGEFNWNEIVRRADEAPPEVRSALRQNPVFTLTAFVFLKTVRVLSRVFFRLEVSGTEHLKGLEGPYLICPNHQSYIDPFVVCSTYPYEVLKNTFHVGASEYFQGFLMKNLAKLLNVVPIDPDTQLLKAMKAGAYGLKNGRILNIYPEGERAFDGRLHPFKKGAAILSTELGLPIVPVALDGLHRVWARKSRKVRLARVRIRFGEPFTPSVPAGEGLTDEERYARITDELKSRIQSMLDEMRA